MTNAEIIHEFCARNMLVEKYLLRELSGMDLQDFELHMFECSICFESVKRGQTSIENLKLFFASRKHRKRQK